ncbi:MAG: Ral GTPase-activating protein subunit alpha-1, variant 2, partial [Marteilia pararefringens]
VQFYRQKSESGECLCFESSSGHSCIKISKEEIESKGLSAEVLLLDLPSEDTLKPTEDPTNIEIAQYKQNNNDLFDELYNSFKDVDFIDKNLLKSIECYKYDNDNNKNDENNAKFELKSDSDIIIPTFTKLDIGCSIQSSFISTIRSQQRSEDNLLFVDENSKSKRDISHLSGLKTLESHKFAIMFVDYCQNTETDIFSNQKASQKFNNFLESLGIFTEKEGNKIFIQYIDMSISLEIHVSTILCLDDVNKKLGKFGIRHSSAMIKSMLCGQRTNKNMIRKF